MQRKEGRKVVHLIGRSVSDVSRGELEDVASEHVVISLVLSLHRWVLGLVLLRSARERCGESEGREGGEGKGGELHCGCEGDVEVIGVVVG